MQFNLPHNDPRNPLPVREPMRANGNLSYLDFVRLVKYLWTSANPDIPMVPDQSEAFAIYPCIAYSLGLRKTFKNEPKFKHRDFVEDDTGQKYRITGQRYDNIVQFSVVTRSEPELADQIIENFEEFMIECVPIFKELGASDFFYSRRLSDNEESRKSEDTCVRTVCYLLVTETVVQTSVDTLESVLINARVFLEDRGSVFTSTSDHFNIPDHTLVEGDRVIVRNVPGTQLPSGLHNGWVYIVATVDGDDFYLSGLQDQIINPGVGTGYLGLWDDFVVTSSVNIIDESATPTGLV